MYTSVGNHIAPDVGIVTLAALKNAVRVLIPNDNVPTAGTDTHVRHISAMASIRNWLIVESLSRPAVIVPVPVLTAPNVVLVASLSNL
jgi:hypothetical protein